MSKTKVTKTNAEKVLAEVRRVLKPFLANGHGPKLIEDWDWVGPTPFAIVWEEGPFEWAFLIPDGGSEQEFGFKVGPIDVPDDVFIEHVTSWAIGIYPIG